MKIAISCDFLIERNCYTEIIEVICELFPEAKIYTFAHRAKAILGRIEQRSIQSTVLSKEISSEKKFYQTSSYRFPLLAQNMFIACKYDLIINISKGLSQGFQKCEDTKQLTFLVDWKLDTHFKKSFIQKIFYPYLERFARKGIQNANYVWVANEQLKSLFPEAEVVCPPFKMSDYALFPKSMFPHHFYLIDATDLDVSLAQEIINWLESENREFQFIGRDTQLKSLNFKKSGNHFFGERCSGEHAPVLAACKAYISFNKNVFPKLALGTLSTGRPVILAQEQRQWVSGVGTYFIADTSLLGLKKAITELELSIDSLEAEKIRAQVNHFHETKFKNRLNHFVQSLV